MKTKLIQSTLLLFVIAFIAKLLSFMIKLQLANSMNTQTMELYTLSSSTMLFLITFVQAGLPTTLNTLIAKNKNTITILQNSIFISFITNIIAISIYVFAIPFLTNNQLQHQQIPVLLSIIPLLPLITISGLCKGYCLGKQNIIIANSSNITEEIIRMLFLILCYPYIQHSPTLYASFAILSIAVGEIGAILHIVCCLKLTKRYKQLFIKNHISKIQIKELLSYSIYMSASRFIGSLTHFIEPLLFTIPIYSTIQPQLVTTFTQIHAYVLPIITLPAFLTFALSSWLLSSLSYHLSHNNKKQAKKILTYVLTISLSIGLINGIINYLFSIEITTLFYHNSQSANLLKQLAIPFIFFTLQTPLSTTLHAYNKSKYAIYDSFIGNVMKLLLMTILPAYIQEQALIYALIISMLVTTTLHAYHIFPLFHNQP